ncbi:MAG: RnfABCDGE type electron transport complex subunit B [Pirellulales bacterium]|nr:RnfABCDGE type electron transport complex subunit B [Pirellulales bacterium]
MLTTTTITILLAAASLSLLSIVAACILGWANRVFYVHVDPKVVAINNALPGANCGGCGYVGCGEYAEAVANKKAPVTLCGPGGASCAAALAEIMGVEVDATYPYRAAIHCSATWKERLGRAEYHGEMTCAAANLVGGYQGCTYGCLGLGDCVRACNYDAIHMIDGLAKVDYSHCIGCRACENVCPRNIISMIPFKSDRMLVVACSNRDFGNDVRAVCKTGCIGCKRCAQKNDLIQMNGNLPVINYDLYQPDADYQPIMGNCSMESLFFIGKPTPKDLAAVADEEMPDRIEADFKTTVDDTEWRG